MRLLTLQVQECAGKIVRMTRDRPRRRPSDGAIEMTYISITRRARLVRLMVYQFYQLGREDKCAAEVS